jgi:UDP-N-acetylmuramate dehydrogenase
LAAGWLVERAGFGKGFPGDGAPARLSTKHALAVTNRGGATTADVIALARAVRDGVRAAFGIELTPEPILIGCTL